MKKVIISAIAIGIGTGAKAVRLDKTAKITVYEKSK